VCHRIVGLFFVAMNNNATHWKIFCNPCLKLQLLTYYIYKYQQRGFIMRHTVKLLALLIVIGLAGCATNQDLEDVRALAQQANVTADAALKTARNAENIAQEAKATSDTTENKVERMVKDQKPLRK
jgi:murein lipoprotein